MINLFKWNINNMSYVCVVYHDMIWYAPISHIIE